MSVELKSIQNSSNSLMVSVRFAKQKVFWSTGLMILGATLFGLLVTTSTTSKKTENSVDAFIAKAGTKNMSCVLESGIPELESGNVSYAFCNSADDEQGFFYITSGGTQAAIIRDNNLDATVMFTRGDSLDIIGLTHVPVSLDGYEAMRQLIKAGDKIVYDPNGVGRKFMSLASSKDLETDGLNWELPDDFSQCSPDNKCLGLKLDPGSFPDFTCDSTLEVDVMWLNWANKVERVFTETFSMTSKMKQYVQIKAGSPKERTLQILDIRCGS